MGKPFLDQLEASNEAAIPEVFSLHQNYPNPSNPITTISFDLTEASHVKLTIFDIQGRPVDVLVNGMREAGIQ